MTDLDLSKYIGHTPGPWGVATTVVGALRVDGDPRDGWVPVADMRQGGNEGSANARLIADAPLLLAEVKRLREELAQAREDHHKLGAWPSCPQCVKFYRDDEEASVQYDRLCQSHARLLAAVKRGVVCSCAGPGCAELRAAVAEAEALHG